MLFWIENKWSIDSTKRQRVEGNILIITAVSRYGHSFIVSPHYSDVIMGANGVSNHQPHHCLLNRLFRRRWKKTSKLRVIGFVRGIHRWPVNSPHKWPVTRKMFPFDDVIISDYLCQRRSSRLHLVMLTFNMMTSSLRSRQHCTHTSIPTAGKHDDLFCDRLD